MVLWYLSLAVYTEILYTERPDTLKVKPNLMMGNLPFSPELLKNLKNKRIVI